MRLVPVKGNAQAAKILYDLLAERPRYAWISHSFLPGRSEHNAFVENHPFRFWYLIATDDGFVGAMEVTDLNEIGVAILGRYQRRGYGGEAVKLFLRTHDPLPSVKAVRSGRWLANVAEANDGARKFFSKLGFTTIQTTMSL